MKLWPPLLSPPGTARNAAYPEGWWLLRSIQTASRVSSGKTHCHPPCTFHEQTSVPPHQWTAATTSTKAPSGDLLTVDDFVYIWDCVCRFKHEMKLGLFLYRSLAQSSSCHFLGLWHFSIICRQIHVHLLLNNISLYQQDSYFVIDEFLVNQLILLNSLPVLTSCTFAPFHWWLCGRGQLKPAFLHKI